MPVNDDLVIEIDGGKVLVQPHLEEPLLTKLIQLLEKQGVSVDKITFIPCG